MVSYGEPNERGPERRFGDAGMYSAMYLMEGGEPVSRKDLVGFLGIGEGSVKTVINLLRALGYVQTSRAGSTLTWKGREFMARVPIIILDPLPPSEFVMGNCQRGVLAKGARKYLGNIMSIRDVSIREGADSCSIFAMDDGRVYMPNNTEEGLMEISDTGLVGALRRAGMGDDDVAVFSGSDGDIVSRNAAISVALTLYPDR